MIEYESSFDYRRRDARIVVNVVPRFVIQPHLS